MREFKVKFELIGVGRHALMVFFVSRSVCNVSNGVLAFVPHCRRTREALTYVLIQEWPPGKHAAWAGPVTGPGCYGWPTCRRDPMGAHPTYHGLLRISYERRAGRLLFVVAFGVVITMEKYAWLRVHMVVLACRLRCSLFISQLFDWAEGQ